MLKDSESLERLLVGDQEWQRRNHQEEALDQLRELQDHPGWHRLVAEVDRRRTAALKLLVASEIDLLTHTMQGKVKAFDEVLDLLPRLIAQLKV